jgi:uncharacterized protein (TIGR01777 family)
MKIIGIAGGSGFIGRYLAALLVKEGYGVTIFSRGKARTDGALRYAQWQPDKKQIDQAALAEVHAMINLAGAGVTARRWTPAYKKEIISSRADATRFLITQLNAHAPHCTTYLSTSATGIYGPDRPGSGVFKEDAPPYPDFLGEVCRLWEAAAATATTKYRTIILRLGIVLGKDGGAYPELAGPMRLGVMPVLGSGKQMVSWVHITDVARMMLYALRQSKIQGTYNCVSPTPMPHRQLMQKIAASRKGVHIPVPVPAFALKIILGESSIEVLKSCTASAEKIMSAEFNFTYPALREAVADLAP